MGWSLYFDLSMLIPLPPPPRLDKLASKKHRDRNINLYKDIVSSLIIDILCKTYWRARFMDSHVLGEQRQVCCPCASPCLTRKQNKEGVSQKGVSGLTELKQMLCGSKCLVQQSLSNVNLLATRREHGEISISLLSTCRQI